MKVSLKIALAICFLLPSSLFAQLPLDSLQRAYTDLRYGMFICFGIETFYGGDYWNNATPPAKTVWNLTNLNCKNWADAAKAAKMKYGLLTVKHHWGFCLWNTSTTTYNCMTTGTLRTDVVKAYCDAFRADSLLPGFYYSMLDIHDTVDGSSTTFNRTMWNKKKAYIEQQLRELLTNYGPIPILVLDGWAWRMGHNAIPYQEIREFVKSIQPNCLVCDHNGLGRPWDNDLVMYEEPKGVYCPVGNTIASNQGMCIVSQASGSWYWTGGGTYMTAANIRTHLVNLEQRYCSFILNCPPNTNGVLPQAMIDTIIKAGNSWTPNMARPALPAQPYNIEHPVSAVAATSGTGANAWNAIEGYNDVFSPPTNVGQTLFTGGAPAQSITLDLGVKYYNLEILGYLPRQDYTGSTRNMTGNITGYIVSVSDNNTTFQQVASGTWPADSTYKIAEWSTPASGRYVRLQATSANGNASVVVNEIAVGGRIHTPTTTPVAIITNNNSNSLTNKYNPEMIMGNDKSIRISLPNDMLKDKTPATLTLFNSQGKLMESVVIPAAMHMQVRSSKLAHGVYMGRLTLDGHEFVSRIIAR